MPNTVFNDAQEDNFQTLKAGAIDSLVVASGFFCDQLRARTYSKVILMDHVDWLDAKQAQEVADTLSKQVRNAAPCPSALPDVLQHASLTLCTKLFRQEAPGGIQPIMNERLEGGLETLVVLLQVVPGGKVIWRSAALSPPYASMIADAGFDVRCLQRADDGFMDRVNMYASFYVATRRQPQVPNGVLASINRANTACDALSPRTDIMGRKI